MLAELFDAATRKLRRDLYITVGLGDWGLAFNSTTSPVGDHLYLQLGPVRVLATLLRPGAVMIQCRNLGSSRVDPLSPSSYAYTDPRLSN